MMDRFTDLIKLLVVCTHKQIKLLISAQSWWVWHCKQCVLFCEVNIQNIASSVYGKN